jgi:hypothetical protein
VSQLHDLIRQERPEHRPTIVRGRIANTPATPDAQLFVTIGSFDGHRQQWGPCRWSPRPGGDLEGLPARGDDCLVLFDEHEEPWILVTCPITFTHPVP